MLAELIDLPAQVEVLEELVRELLELGALLRGHRVEHRLHRGHRRAIASRSSSRFWGLLGEEVAEALHEAREVGLLASLALLDHRVELGEHVLMRAMSSGVTACMSPIIWLTWFAHQLTAHLSMSSSKRSEASAEVKSYSPSSRTIPARSGERRSSSMRCSSTVWLVSS